MSSSILRASVALAAATACGATFAQAPAPIPTDGLWRGIGGAAMAVTSGNSTSRSFLVNGSGQRLTTQDKISVGGFLNYASANGTKSAEKWAGFGQYDWNLTPRMFAFGRLGLEGDGITELDLRSQLAGGVGYKVITTPNTQFTVYGGLGYTQDRYGKLQFIGGKNGTRFSRASLYLAEESSHKLSDTTSFTQRLDLYPGFTGDKAFTARFQAGLAIAMSTTLSANVGLLSNYSSKPALGAKKLDNALFTGINTKFGAL
jgi:putative salt-induced outer membrane protein